MAPPGSSLQHLRKVVPYPWLWVGVYLLWTGFAGGLVFGFLAIRPRGLAMASFVALAALPVALLAVSHWMGRLYDADRVG